MSKTTKSVHPKERKHRHTTSSLFKEIAIPAVVVLLNLLILLFPKDSIGAAKEGLSLWFNNVLPSLLPFIIGTDLMIALGVVNFIGVLLEPVMRPLFRVPGCGGFALAIGLLSGYPMGAKVTADLRHKEEITHEEAQRLIAFTNNSGPLFVIGAVGIGMFGSVTSGYFLITTHYLSALTVGLLFRFYKNKPSVTPSATSFNYYRLLPRAFKSMKDTRHRDSRSFGAILGDSVTKSMETIITVGGFIMLFCVLVKIFDITNLFGMLQNLIAPLLPFVPEETYKGLIAGILEMTNGVNTLSKNGLTKASLIATAAAVSWGGLSIHAQSIKFLSKTDIKLGLYLFTKVAHAGFALIYGLLLYPLFEKGIAVSESSAVAAITDQSFFSKVFISSTYLGYALLFPVATGLFVLFISVLFRKKRRY